MQRCGRALVFVLALGACARSLRDSKQFVQAPPEMEQKIEAFDPTVEKVPPPPAKALPPAKKAPVKKKGKAAAKDAPAAAAAPAPARYPSWSPPYWPFFTGEKLTLVLRYGVIEGGVATLEVQEPKKLEGEPVLHFVGRVRSSKMLEFFYKVDDEIQTWVGLHDFLPRRQEIRQNESSRAGRRVVVFDHKAGVAKFFARTEFPDGRLEEHRRDDAVPHFAQDIFGALYFYRFIDRADAINFPIHDRWKNWNNELVFQGREEITVPAGKFRTLRYKMLPRVSGYLEPKGDVEIWFKDDPSRVIVQFKAKIKVGSITGELKEYVPGQRWDLPLPELRTPTSLNEMGEFRGP
jgi:hypothetical protein